MGALKRLFKSIERKSILMKYMNIDWAPILSLFLSRPLSFRRFKCMSAVYIYTLIGKTTTTTKSVHRRKSDALMRAHRGNSNMKIHSDNQNKFEFIRGVHTYTRYRACMHIIYTSYSYYLFHFTQHCTLNCSKNCLDDFKLFTFIVVPIFRFFDFTLVPHYLASFV